MTSTQCVRSRVLSQFVRALFFLLSFVAFAGRLAAQQSAGVQKHTADPTKLYLQGEKALNLSYAGMPAAVQALSASKPVSLAAGDLDGDGVEDLVAGYAGPNGGSLVLHRGNLDAFAPQSKASWQAIAEGKFPSPFLSAAKVIQLPEAPDFLAVGNFVGSSHLDIAAGARGSHTLYILAGDGKGGFAPPLGISLSGTLTALGTVRFESSTPFSHIVAGTTRQTGSQLTVFEGTTSGIAVIATIALRAPATSLAFGNLTGGHFPDVAIVAGGELQLVRGRDIHAARAGEGPSSLTADSIPVPVTAASVTLGSFIQDRDSRQQLAVLDTSGSVHIVTRANLDTRPWSLSELQQRRRAFLKHQPDPLAVPIDPSEGWQVAESFPSVVSVANTAQAPIFFRTRISSRPSDDIMLVDPAFAQLHVLSHENAAQTAGGVAGGLPPSVHSRLAMNSSQAAVVGIPMRVNIDGRPGVVVLKQGQMAPQVMMPLPDPTFTVNTLLDFVAANPNACLIALPGQCSLREAIIEANNTPGTDTIMVPAGTYTLTVARNPADHSSSLTGTLEVQDSLNIVGATDGSGNPASIVQGGTSLATSVDKVFSFNQDIDSFTTATVSISNFVIQNGHNRGNTSITDGWGGAFDFDTGASPATATLTVTNCNITTNTLTEGEGGGIAIFNTNNGSGFATIVNSTIQNNTAAPSSTGTAGNGGGVFVGTPAAIVLNNSRVLNNSVTANAGVNPVGGGMEIIGPSGNAGQSAIHGGSISGNSAAGDGGGIWNTSKILIDSGAIISNNSTGGNGGGFWHNALNPDTATLSKVTITGNTATGNGGGISVGNLSGGVTLSMTFSRLAGNTAASGRNLNNINSTVNATNNWWGTNTPATTINNTTTSATFDPFIVLTHTATSNKIRINQSSTLTGDMSLDNHGSGATLAGNLNEIIGLPITFNNPILGTIPQAQPETLSASAQATATFNAGGTAGFGHADATVDQQTVTAAITILQPPSIGKAFSPTTVAVNSPSTVTFSITNGNVVPINSSFSDNLPLNLVVASTPSVVNTCGGTVTATAGANSISFGNPTLPVGTCTINVNVQGTTDGVFSNSVTINSTDAGNGNTASATLTVINPPAIAKAFGLASIPFGATTSLTLTVTNSNANSTLNGVAFTDNLPAGLVVATPSGLSSTCSGTATGATGSGSVTLVSASLAPGSSCTVAVNVVGSTVGVKVNSTQVTSANGGTGNTGNASTTVNKADTATTVTSSANPSVFGQSVTFTATVSAVAPGAGNSTGTVTFLDGGSPIGTGTLSGGIATFATPALAVGNHTITTSYGGDGNFNGSTGSLTGNPQVVNKANTATTVTSSVNPSVFGQSVTFTATVSAVAPGTGTFVGTVTFLDGGSPIGTGTLIGGIATFTTPTLAVGNHTITTSYGGDGNFNGSTGSLTGNPQVVNKSDTAATVTSSQNPALVGQSITFTATVSPVAPGSGTPAGTVTFLDGGSPIGTGTLSGGVATFTTSALALGNHTITTNYGGDGNFNGDTGTLTGNPQVVNKATSATTVTSSVNPSVFGQSVTFTATVTAVPPGTGTPVGTVTFLDGGSPIGTGILSGGGVATFTISTLASGSHTITTSYGGDANFSGNTGSLTGNPQVVNKSNSTTSVSSTLNPSAFGQSVTFTATVAPVAPGAGTPTGTVTFLDGGSPIGTGLLSGGIATFTTSALVPGNHTITTSYGGDGNFNGSTGSLTGNPQVVNKSSTTTTVSSSANSSAFGQSVTFTATVSPVAPGAGTPAGTVTFLDGGSPIGTGTLSGGIATFATSGLAVGNHTITTNYGGDGNFNGSTGSLTGNPQVVNKANSTSTVTSSQNPSLIGQPVSFTATVSAVPPGTGTLTGTVTFLDGGSPIGTATLSGGLATFTTSALGLGNHTITTSYGGDGNFSGNTGSLTGNPQVVSKASSTTVVISSLNPSALGQSVTFTATVSPVAPGTGTPTGTVTFLDGGSPIGTGTLSGGVTALSLSGLAGGNHTITTSYAGDGNFGASTGSLTGNPQVVIAPPLATKSFAPSVIAPNGASVLTLTITNPAANTVPLVGVAIADNFPANLVVATPNGLTNSCGGTATATAGGGSVSLTGGSVAAHSSCSITVNVTSGVSGSYLNSTGPVSSTNGGTGGSATATLAVAIVPSITKAFGAASIGLAGSTSLTFRITNPNSSVAFTGVAFTDALPGGLVVSTPNGLTGTCGAGVVAATAGAGTISLTGGTIAASSSCSFSVNVTGVTAGTQVNTTGNVSATNGGTGNTATASITVLAPDLTIAKSHTGKFFQGQTGAAYTVTASNAGPGPTAGTVTVTEVPPAGLTVTGLSGTGWNCSPGSASCTRSDALAAGASYPSITVTVNVATNAASTVTNTVTVSGGGEVNVANDSASDSTIVTLPPDFALSMSPATISVRAGTTATYAITVTPQNNVFANAIDFTVTGLPSKASFVFTPSSVTPGANPATSKLILTTTGGDPFLASNSPAPKARTPLYALLLPISGLVLSGMGFSKRAWRQGKTGWLLLVIMLASCGVALNGCASAQNFKNFGTPPGTYNVTITATSGTTQHSAPVTLVVQP